MCNRLQHWGCFFRRIAIDLAAMDIPAPPQADQTTPKRVRNIAELAKLAGVSPGTVSRALAGKSLVNPKTRERIQALASEHGFQINQMASKLRRQKTGVIAVIIPLGHDQRQHISDPFFMTLLGALADELTQSGYHLMLSRAIPQDDPLWLDRIVNSGMVDGVLMIGQSNQLAEIEQVAQHYAPLVVWGNHTPGQVHCAVGSDNFAGGRAAAQHLLDQGRRSLAFLGDTEGVEIAERYRGALAAVAECGGAARLHHLPIHLSVDEMTDEIAAALAALGGDIDGVVAASDMIAMATIRQLDSSGIAVPDDIAVIGFDDLPLARHTVPQLTTIRQDIALGAREMVARLMARLGGERSPSLVMPPELVIRASA
jgi:DNA-binding LacI/PurR family transcriptional regulator